MSAPIDFKMLQAKFQPEDIEWRVQRAGKGNKPWAMVLAYVDARAVQNRLDEVCGPENWKDEYEEMEGGMLCKLSIRVSGEWVTKQNGSPETKVEGFKGGFSKALVRTASSWGIGRYLYNLEESFALIVEKGTKGARYAKHEGNEFYWTPPKLPEWALPEGQAQKPAPAAAAAEAPKSALPPPTEKAKQKTFADSKHVDTRKITDDQRKRMFKIAKVSGWSEQDVRDYMQTKFGIDSTSKLTRTSYDELCKFIEGNPTEAARYEAHEQKNPKP